MNTQDQRFFDTQQFRIAVIAVAVAAALALAAFWFGTGLRADTSASVAPSPLGSSLTNIREGISPDFVERLSNSAAAARSASPALLPAGSSDFFIYLRGSPALLPASSSDFSIYLRGSPALLPASSSDFSIYLRGSPAALSAGARPSQGSSGGMVESTSPDQQSWIKPEGIKPSAAAGSVANQSPWIKPEGLQAQ